MEKLSFLQTNHSFRYETDLLTINGTVSVFEDSSKNFDGNVELKEGNSWGGHFNLRKDGDIYRMDFNGIPDTSLDTIIASVRAAVAKIEEDLVSLTESE